MKKMMFIIVILVAYIVAKSPIGKLFHECLMESVHEEFPQAESFRDWVKLTWQEEMATSTKDDGYTNAETMVLGLVVAVLLGIALGALSMWSYWPWLVTGFCLLPAALFVGWLGVRLYIWANNWVEKKIQNFLYTTRMDENGSAWGYFDNKGDFTMIRRMK